mgnify:CR=1 FL=1
MFGAKLGLVLFEVDAAGTLVLPRGAFGPLMGEGNRPAIQIRQMGTLPSHQRQGNAAKVLGDLEKSANKILGAKTGFLQARAPAIPFYESQGWVIIDEEYDIPGIGPHRSMMKHLN